MDSDTRFVYEGPSTLKEKIQRRLNTFGIWLDFDIDPNKTSDEIEKIYQETLGILDSLTEDEISKAKEAPSFRITEISDLDELKKTIGREVVVAPEPPPVVDQTPEPPPIVTPEPPPVVAVEPPPVVREKIGNVQDLDIAGHKFGFADPVKVERGGVVENGWTVIRADPAGKEVEVYKPGSDGERMKIPVDEFLSTQNKPITEPSPELATEPPPIVEQEKSFEEEWGEFENLRNDLAKTEALKGNFSGDTGMSIEDLRVKYENEKERMAGLIRKREYAKLNTEGPLTKDDEKHFNDYLFDELVVKENEAYINALKANREKTWKDTAKEVLRNTLGSKVVQGYMSLSKGQRIAFNLALGSTVGLLAGAAVAPGMAGAASYLGWRAARFGLSAGAGIKAGEWANKKWSLEELEAKEREEIEALKNSQLSVGEKSKRLDEIENRYKKQKSWLNFKKIGTTVAAGAGAGLLTGLLEQASVSLGRGPKMVIEPPSKGSGSIDNRLPGRQGFGQTNLKVAQNEVVIEKPVAPKPESAMPEPVAPKAEVTNDSQPTETEAAKTVETPIVPPEVMTHEVKSGDSVWKLLEKTLDNNEKFKVMSEAQKTYVLSNLTGKMLGSPATYGFKPGGGVEIGYKLDFTEALDDNKEVESLFEKAKQTIGEGSKQEDLIVENNEKILEFLEDHPNEPLNEEAVAKILNTRPKVEFTPIKTDSLLVIERDIAELVKSNNLPPESVEKLIKIGEEGKVLRARILEFEKTDQSAPDFNRNNFLAEKLKLEEEMTKIEGRMADIIEENKKPNTPYESGEVKTALQNEVNNDIANEIAKARKGFPVPESSPGPTGLRSMSGDVVNLNSNVDAAFREEIDSIYGKGGVLGFFGKTAGVDTKEWGEIRGLSAKDVIQYYEDPEHSRLPAKIIKSLATSDKHRRLMEQIAGIQEQIFDTVKFNGENIKIEPRDNGESVENFIKRLGAFLMKQPNK